MLSVDIACDGSNGKEWLRETRVRRTPSAAAVQPQSALAHVAMTDTAAARPNDTISGQLSLSATDVTTADAADAAAAATLVALPQPAAAAAGECMDGM